MEAQERAARAAAEAEATRAAEEQAARAAAAAEAESRRAAVEAQERAARAAAEAEATRAAEEQAARAAAATEEESRRAAAEARVPQSALERAEVAQRDAEGEPNDRRQAGLPIYGWVEAAEKGAHAQADPSWPLELIRSRRERSALDPTRAQPD